MPRSLTAALLVTAAAGGFALLTACDSSSDDTTRGSTTAPATASFSGAVPSQLSSLASAGQSAASAAVSSLSAVASGFEASVDASAASASAAARAALDAASGRGNATADVSLTGLPTAQTGGLHAVVVNVVNRTTAPASYAVKVEFADSSGKVVDTAVVGTAEVAPGDKATPIAFSSKDADKKLFPRVAQAQRY